MIAFYIMIVSRRNPYLLHFSYRNIYEALCAWFYPGQPELQYLSQCESVALALTQPPASLVDLWVVPHSSIAVTYYRTRNILYLQDCNDFIAM